MKKLISGIFITILLCSLCFAVLPNKAFAADTAAEVSVPVKITFSGESPENAEVFKILLTSDTPTFPLPDGSIDGSFVLNTHEENSDFLNISYTQTGVYTYKIVQQVGDNKNLVYDNTVYNLKVYVTREENGELVTSVVLHNDIVPEKLDEIQFTNTYNEPPTSVMPESSINSDTDKDSEKDTSSKTVSSRTPAVTVSTVANTTVTSQPTVNSTVQSNPFKTGDTRPVALFFLVMILSLIGVAGSLSVYRCNKKHSL